MKKQLYTFSTGIMVICLSLNVTAQTSVPAPPLPNYSLCSGRPDEGSCRQYLDAQYQQNLATYTQAVAAEDAARKAAEQAAKEAALTSQTANNDGKNAYNKSSMLAKVVAVAAAAAYAASGGTNMAALALSIFMAMQSMKAKEQAQSHVIAGYNSCTTANNLSTAQANCGPPPGSFTPDGYPASGTPDVPDLIDTTGRCVASAAMCTDIANSLPPGTDLKDYAKNINGFAGPNAPYKVNKDGSITAKNGKTYSLNDFRDAASMAANGMSPSDIALAAQMAKNSGLGNGGLDAKKDLKALAGLNGELEDAAARAAAAAAAAAAAQDMDLNGLGKKDRNLASAEGLAKDFNGELIGVAGDNIWKMMNRRYKLKTAQDAFMNTAKP